MKRRMVMTLITGLFIFTGCSQPSKPARSKGIESLFRVQLKVESPDLPDKKGSQPANLQEAVTPEQLQARAVAMLMEHLPQLDIEGTEEDWTLEIKLQWMFENRSAAASKAPARVCYCKIRVLKNTIIDGRRVEAIAYQNKSAHVAAGFGGSLYSYMCHHSLSQALDTELMKFIKQWHEVNP